MVDWTAVSKCPECEEAVYPGDHCPECLKEDATLVHDRCCDQLEQIPYSAQER